MLSLNQQIDPTNPAHQAMLANLQANILKHHGRKQALHIFLQFDASRIAAIKQWISEFAKTLTRAGDQLHDSKRHRFEGFDGGMVRCFFLTASGFKKLGLEEMLPQDEAFRAGINAGLFAQPYEQWEDKFKQTDAMILLADDRLPAINLPEELFTKIGYQKGEVLWNDNEDGIEHFGYVDGVSQPSFIKDAVPAGKTWDDNALPEILLVEESPDCYGSYMVFLKLEQDVAGFKQAEEKIGDLLQHYAPGEIDKEIAGAYVVGRFEAGNPVVKHNTEYENKLDNDFDYRYDKNGSRCPFHAHIRTTNPRNGLKTGPFPRITRRGIPYDEAGRNGDMDWHPSKDVGLLFMSYQASIKSQFEVLQQTANNSAFGIDPVIGNGNNTQRQRWPEQWGEAARIILTQDFAHFVSMKGGEYYYAASIPFLQGLANP